MALDDSGVKRGFAPTIDTIDCGAVVDAVPQQEGLSAIVSPSPEACLECDE